MEKKIFLLILIAVLAAGVFFLKPWKRHRPTPQPVRQTTIRVVEGAVDVYEYDERGKPRFKQLLFEGEKIVLASRPLPQKSASKGPEFNPLLPFAARAAELFRKEMEQAVLAESPGRHRRFFSEEEIVRFMLNELPAQAPIDDIQVEMDEKGFSGSGLFQLGPAKFRVAGNGMVRVGPDKKLYLELGGGRIGVFGLPPFALHAIEDAFEAAMAASSTPHFRLLSLDYAPDGVYITYLRI